MYLCETGECINVLAGETCPFVLPDELTPGEHDFVPGEGGGTGGVIPQVGGYECGGIIVPQPATAGGIFLCGYISISSAGGAFAIATCNVPDWPSIVISPQTWYDDTNDAPIMSGEPCTVTIPDWNNYWEGPNTACWGGDKLWLMDGDFTWEAGDACGDTTGGGSCGVGEWDCYGDGTECIPDLYVCSGTTECSNGSDEEVGDGGTQPAGF